LPGRGALNGQARDHDVELVGPIELLNQLTKNVLETALAAIWSLRRGGERGLAGCVWGRWWWTASVMVCRSSTRIPARTQARTW
jgi:hypothetical protein